MNSRFDKYLDELEKPMGGADRAAWRREARQHIEELAAAHEELGTPTEAAFEAALRQFGEAERIGLMVERAQRRGQNTETLRVIYHLCRVPTFALLTSVILFLGVCLGTDETTVHEAMRAYLGAVSLLAPCLTGCDVGWRLRQWACRPGAAPARSSVVRALVGLAFYLVYAGVLLRALATASAPSGLFLYGSLATPAALVTATWTYRILERLDWHRMRRAAR